MKIAGLFAGIGGLELGLGRSGHETVLVSEILPGAQEVLRRNLRHADIRGDVRELRSLPRDVDMICGGFPCQDLSQAGTTAGLDGERSGLVGEIFRLARRRRPDWILLENVPFMLQLSKGEAMLRIIDEIERMGYRWAWRVVDTFGFGLPQRRERVYLLASRVAVPADVLLTDERPLKRPETRMGEIAHGFYWTEGRGGLGWAADAVPTLKNGSSIGIPSPPAILLANGNIIKPDIRDAERLQGFEEDWTLPAESVGKASARWSLVGSAVSVPVAQWIGERLRSPGAYSRDLDGEFANLGKLPRAARYDGKKRMSVAAGLDPLGIRPPHLEKFLRYEGVPLSEKATAGFYSRTQVAKLRFAPGFIAAVVRHLKKVSNSSSQISAKRVA